MPVPSYNLIADSEIDPESPLTSSLFFRLRDNWMAVFGIDNTDPAPAPSLPPSTLEKNLIFYHEVDTTASSGTITGPEGEMSLYDNSMESIDVRIGEMIVASEGTTRRGEIVYICPVYASGVLTAIRFRFVLFGSLTSETTITATNTWQTFLSWQSPDTTPRLINDIQMKLRLDSTSAYLQSRIVITISGTPSSRRSYYKFIFNRTNYRPKILP